MDSEESEVRIYFNDKEWNSLLPLEQKRFSNIKKKCDVMKAAGKKKKLIFRINSFENKF
jgi:hypothetical protein